MTNLSDRLIAGTTNTLIWTPVHAVCGYLWGYAYARAVNLPPAKVALYWAIFSVASHAMSTIATSFFESKKVNHLITATVTGVSGGYFIHEMQRQGLMGKNMVMFMVTVQAVAILCLLYLAFSGEKIVPVDPGTSTLPQTS